MSFWRHPDACYYATPPPGSPRCKKFHLYTPPPLFAAATAAQLPSANILRKPLRPCELLGKRNYFHLL